MVSVYEDYSPIYFKELSPTDFYKEVKGKSNNKRNDIEIIQGLLFKYQIAPEILNVIVHHLIVIKNDSLTEEYMEHVVKRFVEKNLKTVEEAIFLIEGEHKVASSNLLFEKKKQSYKFRIAIGKKQSINERIDQAVESLKKNCSQKQKEALLLLINDIIENAAQRRT